MTEGFRLAQRLETDSFFLFDWPLCQVRLMDDVRFPWLILVPRRPDLEEWIELGPDDAARLAGEIGNAGRVLAQAFNPTKVNVGTLGNIVRQMHVHIVARFDTDAAWPGPVWGHGARIPYEIAEKDRLSARLMPMLK